MIGPLLPRLCQLWDSFIFRLLTVNSLGVKCKMSAANTTKGHRHHRHHAHHYCQSVNSHQSKDKSYYSRRSELEAGFDQA